MKFVAAGDMLVQQRIQHNYPGFEYVSLAEAAIFEYAFRFGARLIIEVQKDSKD